MNLIFRHKGHLRQGDEFIHYSTGEVSRPLVYVSHDGGEVFLVSRALTGAFSVRALSQRQWMQVRAKYHLAPVEFLASSEPSVDAMVGDIVTKPTFRSPRAHVSDTIIEHILDSKAMEIPAPTKGTGDGQEAE